MSNKVAVLPSKHSQIQIQSTEIAQPGKGEILLKSTYASSNPVDFKIQQLGIIVQNYPAAIGSDVSGIVEAVGEGVTRFKVGDRVFSWASIFKNNFTFKYAAYQEHVITEEVMSGLIPSNIPDEVAVLVGGSAVTAVMALFSDLKIERPPLSKEKVGSTSDVIFINGGSTACGAIAVQLAVLSGLKVIATSSPKNFAYVKSLGASSVFDYKSESILGDIRDYLKGEKVTHVLDCENNEKTLAVDIELLNGSGILSTLLFVPEGTDFKGATYVKCFASNIWKNEDLLKWTYPYFSSALGKGLLLPVRPEIVAFGIEETQKMLDYHASGKVSASKPVLKF